MTYGASPTEWAILTMVLGLTEDLLPVVSNPLAKVSPNSTMLGIGKTPSIYNANRLVIGFSKWPEYVATDRDVKKWASEGDYGVCIQTRSVRAIDVDVTDAAQAVAIEKVITDSLGPLPARRRGNSSKFLVMFYLSGDYTKRSFKTEHGLVENLATGQQFIALGTHTSGVKYEWDGGLPSDIPVITPAKFERLWAKLVETFAVDKEERGTLSTKKETLNAAISTDPVAQHLIDHHWVYSIEKDGRLNIRCPNEAAHTSASSETATVYYPANTGGYARGHFDCKHAHCQSLTDEEFQRGVGYDDLAFDDLTGDPGRELLDAPVSTRFDVVHISAFRQRKSQGYHIKGVIPKGDMVMVFGPPGSGKSFISFDMAMAIARGTAWRGHRVTQGTVAYIIAEGAGGFSARIQAYADYHGVDTSQVPFYLIPDNPNLLQAKDTKDLIAALETISPDIVIIDTWAQVTAGGNENSGEDMGKALAHCRAINKRTGATVYIVHHSGKDAAKGARGWSGLKGAADAELEIARSGDDRVLSVTKLKDGVDNLDFGFKLNVVTLGQDDDGDDITSCVVLEHDVNKAAISTSKVHLGKLEAVIMKVVVDGVDLDEDAPDVNSVIVAAVDQIPFDSADGKKDKRRENIRRAYLKLVERNLLREDDGRVYANT